MPVIIKTSELQYKDGNGDYHGINAVAEKKVADQIADLDAAISQMQTAADGIESQSQTMIARIASVAGQGTDTTLSQTGVAADAKATGDLKAALKDKDGNVILADTLKSTLNKTDTTVNIRGLDLYANDKKITITNGKVALQNATGFRIYRMSSENISKLSVTLKSAFAQWIYVAVVTDNEDNVSGTEYLLCKAATDYTVNITPKINGYVYIVLCDYNTSPNQYYDAISCINYAKITDVYKPEIEGMVEEGTKTIAAQANNEMRSIPIVDLELVSTDKRFTVTNGGISFVAASGFKIYKMPSDGIRKISVTLKNAFAQWVYAVAVSDSEGNVSDADCLLCRDAKTYSIEISPITGGYVYVNLVGYTDVPNTYYDNIGIINYIKISDAYKTEIEDIVKAQTSAKTIYKTLVRRPFAFSEKRINFAGDSITKGYVDGEHITTNNYPNLFCGAVGATPINKAIGGATFSTNTNKSHIIDQVTSTDKNNDILFIAAGINDWVLGVELSDFETAVKNVCDYLNDQQNGFYNKPVIWITPINQAGWEDTHVVNQKGTVDDYRNIMTRVIIENDVNARFSIVQGREFCFPTKYDDANYISAMFGDKLHPSELGYKTAYLAGLLTALC